MVRPAAPVAALRRAVAAGFAPIAVVTDLGGRSHAASYNGTSGFGRPGTCASQSGCFRLGHAGAARGRTSVGKSD